MDKHELDPFSLVSGALFALLGVAFIVARPDVTSLRWVWPIPVLVLGLLIVLLAVRPGPDGQTASSDPRPTSDQIRSK
jgi:hypothetical protein